MHPSESRALAAFRERFGAEPDILASAPGRINLIGEHTDYSGGFVLPCAIDRRIAVALRRGDGDLYSADFQESRPPDSKDGSWADYPRGVVWALSEAGYSLEPIQAVFAGDVPIGAGLSSSAAIEAATALGLDARFGLGIPRPTMARLCQRAENQFVGVNCGIMDQYASLLCQPDAALLIDCRSLRAELVPIDLERATLSLLVCDTRVKRSLGVTGYNERRAACERAARILGVPLLRDATETDLQRLGGIELKRARHVVTENARVLAAVAALRAGDFAAFGELMYQSHASLRDDFEVSVPELDTFVELARASGALGARLTGAGFGGCAIALIGQERTTDLIETTRTRFQERGFTEPAFYVVQPAGGAAIAR